ncbi:hypothetical protein JCM8547_002222 [Rhodosporidiobolus lusitaniae]
MKFSLPALLLSLLAVSSSASAACASRRARRDLSARAIVEGGKANAGAANIHRRSSSSPRNVKGHAKRVKTVVRRQKGGNRMNSQGGGGNRPSRPSASNGNTNSNSNSGSSFSSANGNNTNYAKTSTEGSSSMTTQKAARQTTSSYKAATTTSSSAKSSSTASSSSSSSASSSSTYSGQATYYLQGGVAGACGTVHEDTDYIIALQTSMYADGDNCGKTVTITNAANSKSVTATVADECPSCESSTSIDLSESVFEAIGDLDTGVLTVEWSFSS